MLSLGTLLRELVDKEENAKEVERELIDLLNSLHDKILDPMEQQGAAEALANLNIGDLRSPAFNEPKIKRKQCQNVLESRKVEDDKQIKWHLEEFSFDGLKTLLGKPPDKSSSVDAVDEPLFSFDGLKRLLGKPKDKSSSVDAAHELFHQRLETIATSVRNQISLAKQCVSNPESFGKQIQKLRVAEKEMGEYLQLYQDRCQFVEWTLRSRSVSVLQVSM